MGDLAISLFLAIILIVVLGTIEVARSSGATVRAYLGWWWLAYIFVLGIGNTATTIAASVMVKNANLPGPVWFWSPFFGVFAFQGILKNTNIRVFGKGVLSIEDWIGKAHDQTVAAALRKQESLEKDTENKTAKRLQLLPEEELNTYVAHHLGPEEVKELEKKATQCNADANLLKALALAKRQPEQAAAIAKGKNKKNTDATEIP